MPSQAPLGAEFICATLFRVGLPALVCSISCPSSPPLPHPPGILRDALGSLPLSRLILLLFFNLLRRSSSRRQSTKLLFLLFIPPAPG